MTPNPEDTRYRIYTLVDGVPEELARTSRDGIGLCLVTLREEEQITNDDRVGILDRIDDDATGTWLLNPFARCA